MESSEQAKTEKLSRTALWGILFAGLALIVSIISLFFSWSSMVDVRTLGRLTIRPKLEIRAWIGHKGPVSQLRIRNPGPETAEQLVVDWYLVSYIKPTSKSMVVGSGSKWHWEVGDFPPLADTIIYFDHKMFESHILETNPIEKHVLVARFNYRRPADAKLFSDKAYFFLNPERRWVGEHDNSLTPEIYDPIKETVFEHWPEETAFRNLGTPLHSSDNDE